MKTLKEITKDMTLEEIRVFIKNKKFKVILNTSGSGIPIGEIIEFMGIQGTKTYLRGLKTVGLVRLSSNLSTGAWCYFDELVLVSPITITELEEEIVDKKKQILGLEKSIIEDNLKIKFMKENNIEEFSEDEFKVYKTLELLDNKKLSKIEKAKLISSLIAS